MFLYSTILKLKEKIYVFSLHYCSHFHYKIYYFEFSF
jgi:hypothetical protein